MTDAEERYSIAVTEALVYWQDQLDVAKKGTEEESLCLRRLSHLEAISNRLDRERT
jgi:hypothetical protein